MEVKLDKFPSIWSWEKLHRYMNVKSWLHLKSFPSWTDLFLSFQNHYKGHGQITVWSKRFNHVLDELLSLFSFCQLDLALQIYSSIHSEFNGSLQYPIFNINFYVYICETWNEDASSYMSCIKKQQLLSE